VPGRKQLAHFDFDLDGPIAVAPSGRWVAWGVRNMLYLYDMTRRQLSALAGHVGKIDALGFSPDGRSLATSGRDDYVLLWSVAAARQAAMLPGSARGSRCLAFSPDGRVLAAGFDDGSVSAWRAAQ